MRQSSYFQLEKDSVKFLTILEIFQRTRRWPLDNFSLIQLADNCCPKRFKTVIGVASFDNSFSDRDFEELLKTPVTAGQK